MEVAVPRPHPPPLDFNFDSAYSSPYTTAPSSPQRINTSFYVSAPPSPTRASSNFFKEFEELSFFTAGNNPFRGSSSFSIPSSSSAIPFNWEEKPGTPKAKSKDNERPHDNFGEEFEFNFSGQLDRASLSADELFDKGKIRPLKPPPGHEHSSTASQSSSPRSPTSRALLSKKREFDPFQAALEETRKKDAELPATRVHERGREAVRTTSARKKGSSRSLSPLRITDIMFEDHQEESNTNFEKIKATSNKSNSRLFSAISFSSKPYRKWKLKDLLLFRSASEGSGSTRTITGSGSDSRDGSMGKYAVLSKKETIAREDVKNSSFRSTEGSVGGISRRRMSSAELHYTANRAVAEEMRRKTPLPYKQGLLGCLWFNYHNPSAHELSRGIGSLARGR